ncbi:hypothetical protein HDE_00501 [Halotydeus destructor]|nr:hypothetical protein HDE_00501 [Halotydeus destructor]
MTASQIALTCFLQAARGIETVPCHLDHYKKDPQCLTSAVSETTYNGLHFVPFERTYLDFNLVKGRRMEICDSATCYLKSICDFENLFVNDRFYDYSIDSPLSTICVSQIPEKQYGLTDAELLITVFFTLLQLELSLSQKLQFLSDRDLCLRNWDFVLCHSSVQIVRMPTRIAFAVCYLETAKRRQATYIKEYNMFSKVRNSIPAAHLRVVIGKYRRRLHRDQQQSHKFHNKMTLSLSTSLSIEIAYRLLRDSVFAHPPRTTTSVCSDTKSTKPRLACRKHSSRICLFLDSDEMPDILHDLFCGSSAITIRQCVKLGIDCCVANKAKLQVLLNNHSLHQLRDQCCLGH